MNSGCLQRFEPREHGIQQVDPGSERAGRQLQPDAPAFEHGVDILGAQPVERERPPRGEGLAKRTDAVEWGVDQDALFGGVQLVVEGCWLFMIRQCAIVALPGTGRRVLGH